MEKSLAVWPGRLCGQGLVQPVDLGSISKISYCSHTKPILLLMLQTQPFLHQTPSRISSVALFVAKRHGSFQFYRGSFAGAGFSCPGRTFGCMLGHPSDQIKFLSWLLVAPPKCIYPVQSCGFYRDVWGILPALQFFLLCLSGHK